MKIIVLPRLQAQDFCPEEPWVAISIRTPGATIANISGVKRFDILRLMFYDCSSDEIGPDLADHLFSDSQAKEIWNFVNKWKDRVDLMLIHCEAGVSRSPATAAAISKYLTGENEIYFKNYFPNERVYDILTKTMPESLNPQDNQ